MQIYPDPELRQKVKEVLAVQLAALNGDKDGLTVLLADADLSQLRRWCAYLALTQAALAGQALPGYRDDLLKIVIEASR